MSKLCFFDIDGTIMGPSRVIRQANLEALRALRANGHKIILCSGRAPCSISQEILDIGWDGVIASAGSYIFVNGQKVYEHAIEYHIILKVFYVFFKFGVLFSLECENYLYQSPGINDFFEARRNASLDKNLEAKRMKEDRTFNKARRTFEEWDGTVPVAKITFVCQDKATFEKAIPFLDDFNIVYFCHDEDPFVNGEIILKNHTKGDGVKFIANYFNYDLAHTISFGDSMNDYEMLITTNKSYVSELSSDNLKELSDGLFEEPDHDGMAKLLKELELI